jgi:hypothetical protein
MCPQAQSTNKFDIFLYSEDKASGTPSRANFSFASTGFSTDLSQFVNYHTCYVKLKYFAIDAAASTLISSNANLHTIRFNIDTASLPHSFSSNAISANNSANLLATRTIGLVPISNPAATYLSTDFENNYVRSSNIFSGDTTIVLTDQSGTALTLTDKKWTAQLCVYFDDEEYKKV